MTQRSAGLNGNRYDFIQVIVVNAHFWLLFPFNLSMSLRLINYSERSSRHKLAIYAIYLARLWYFHRCTWKVCFRLFEIAFHSIIYDFLKLSLFRWRLNEKLRHSATFNRTFSFAKTQNFWSPPRSSRRDCLRLWYLTSHLSKQIFLRLIGFHWFTSFDLSRDLSAPKKCVTKLETRESLKKKLLSMCRVRDGSMGLDDTEKVNIKHFIVWLWSNNRLRKIFSRHSFDFDALRETKAGWSWHRKEIFLERVLCFVRG